MKKKAITWLPSKVSNTMSARNQLMCLCLSHHFDEQLPTLKCKTVFQSPVIECFQVQELVQVILKMKCYVDTDISQAQEHVY